MCEVKLVINKLIQVTTSCLLSNKNHKYISKNKFHKATNTILSTYVVSLFIRVIKMLSA